MEQKKLKNKTEKKSMVKYTLCIFKLLHVINNKTMKEKQKFQDIAIIQCLQIELQRK